ncbi:MAG: oligosaccharide flippase family protein [candidate division KSB1 bacterium]|nr:oligosaccharide flippase family protein [candidate division KSB1 bacterium]
MNPYRNIFKTTGVIGLVQVFKIISGLLRNKMLALFTGTLGFGTWGLYQSYIEMMSQISLLGLDQSGVRQIAKNSKSPDKVYKSIFIVRWCILIVSICAAIISILFSKKISLVILNSEKYYWGIIIVSFVILLNGISKGQISILTGLRDIKGLAWSQIIGSIIGSAIAIFVIFILGTSGIPLFLFTVGLAMAVSTGYFVNKLDIKKIIPSITEAVREFKILIYLGLGFCISNIVATVMTYLSNIYLQDFFNVDTVGIYRACWSISNIYIGIILTSMGVDLMPRLTMVVGDKKKLKKIINEQMELGILIASIGVNAILIFSPLVLFLIFSSEFVQGARIIRWQILGVSLRIMAFPFSYLIMAKGKSLVYIFIQSVFWIIEFLLLIFFTKILGFSGLGINYFAGYTLYFLMAWIICKKLVNIKFSLLLKKILFIFIVLTVASIITSLIKNNFYRYSLGIILLLINLYWIIFILKNKMQFDIVNELKNRF